ncbi:MAG: RNA 2',3'-cyclic phosphodiesterase [Nitratireductor sp.]|jgi:2'-5' RNA ligase|nr:RNA 2',3'-cyclic phosphodiesterase [Nitratireductor sp.]
MPRLFTALEVPGDVALSLSFLRGGLPGARWIDAENYHITLRFIGDTDFRTADELVNALARVERGPVKIRLSGLDAFGGNKPHSIHACVERNAGLTELQAEHERIAQRVGLKPEGRKFVPHVTIARLRGAKGSDVGHYLSLRGLYSAPPFLATSFVLYSSKDSVGGGPYIVEDRFPLIGKREAGSAETLAFRHAGW